MKALYSFFLLVLSNLLLSQSITMEFPAFADKTYEFIIFQGDKSVTIIQDTIPKDGKFVIKIPEQYAPYSGMSRWLITNTTQGGGLDLLIDGQDFGVKCLFAQPSDDNIIFSGKTSFPEFAKKVIEQKKILDRYQSINNSISLYGENDIMYGPLSTEKNRLNQEYINFHKTLRANNSIIGKMMPIFNLTNGIISEDLSADDELKAKNFNNYFTEILSIDDLYVSGHWSYVIQNWVMLHMTKYNDKKQFLDNCSTIFKRIERSKIFEAFLREINHNLTRVGKDTYIESLAQIVAKSGKIINQHDSMEKYLSITIGGKAPNLKIEKIVGDSTVLSELKYNELCSGETNKILLIFAQIDCGTCTEVLEIIKQHYAVLLKNKIDVVTIVSSLHTDTTQNISEKYPWKHTYFDKASINYNNYSVLASPSLFLINEDGKVELKGELLNAYLKTL